MMQNSNIDLNYLENTLSDVRDALNSNNPARLRQLRPRLFRAQKKIGELQGMFSQLQTTIADMSGNELQGPVLTKDEVSYCFKLREQGEDWPAIAQRLGLPLSVVTDDCHMANMFGKKFWRAPCLKAV